MVKIDLTFEINHFSYTSPIRVRHEWLAKNQMLTVHLFKNGKEIDQLHFCALNNLHTYNLLQWKFVLERFFAEADISEATPAWTKPYFGLVKKAPMNLSGELLFIVESILLKAFFNLNVTPPSICGFYSPDSALCHVLKYKIRPDQKSLNECLNLLGKIKEWPLPVRVRLDGNQSFTLSELQSFMSACEQAYGSPITCLEYIEEPFKHLRDSLSWKDQSPYPLALDESLETLSSLSVDYPLFKNFHLVLRPSLLGISTCIKLMDVARRNNKLAVLSSSYEAGSLMRVLYFLATFFPETAHGLDTLKFLPEQYGIKEIS